MIYVYSQLGSKNKLKYPFDCQVTDIHAIFVTTGQLNLTLCFKNMIMK